MFQFTPLSMFTTSFSFPLLCLRCYVLLLDRTLGLGLLATKIVYGYIYASMITVLRIEIGPA